MNAVHIICRRLPNGRLDCVEVVDAKNNIYSSRGWDFTMEEAETLVGGMIYLHQTKASPSAMGGVVLSAERSMSFDKSRMVRILFNFRSTKEGRGQKWRGADHGMAWTGGIIDVDD